MSQIQNIRIVQKSQVAIPDLSKRAKLPIVPSIINWLKIKKLSLASCSVGAAWNSAYEVLKFLHSTKSKVKKLETNVVDSIFKIIKKTVDAPVIEYSDWLKIKLQMIQAQNINSYIFSLQLLDNRTIGAVIKGEHDEVIETDSNLVELIKVVNEDTQELDYCENVILVEEYFFVYINDISVFGMIKVQHQELIDHKEIHKTKSEIA